MLIRGVSGSGKTTFAKLMSQRGYLHDDWPVISADDYFTDKDGNYNWTVDKLGQAHTECKNTTEFAMIAGQERIFVANTFVSERDLKPYYDLAKRYTYRVFSIVVENRANTSSIHDVPEETIEKQKSRFNLKL